MGSQIEIRGGGQNIDVAHLEGEIVKRLDRTAGSLGFAELYKEFSDLFGLPLTKAANLTRTALGELNELRIVKVNEVSRTVALVQSELPRTRQVSELSGADRHGTTSGSQVL